MKLNYFISILISISFFLLLGTTTFGQYLETFPTPEKGILLGPCPGGTAASCTTTDFTGVDWAINGNFVGFDNVSGAEDYMKTISGAFEFGGDIDEELCWESPILDISAAGSVTYSVFIEWNSQDNADFIDVEYQINAGAWTQIPNQHGGGSHTIDYTTSGNSGSGTIMQAGISGSTLSVRVCVDTNTSGELTRIDNVSVPGAIILPVELISFKAQKREDEVMLNWATASEIDNEKFEIEHSTTGERFEKIGETAGRGTSIQTNQYSFTHQRPIAGPNYYRLKQIDFNGQYEYSQVATVKIEKKEAHIGTFYPNPTKDGIVNLDYFSNKKSDLKLSIFDATGRNVFEQQLEIIKGTNQLDFNFSNLAKGIYFAHLEHQGNIEFQKLIVD